MDALVNSLMEELNCETVFTIPIFGGIPIYESVVVTWIIMAVVIVLCILLTRNLSVEHPGRRQIILETAVNGLNNFFRDTIGENGKQYIPYLMTVAIYIGIRKFLYQRVMNVIEAREEMVKKQFDDAKKSEEDARKLKADYEERLSDARTEADQIIIDARARAEEEHARSVEKTREETEHMLEKAKEDIANEQEKAQQAAQAEIAKLAVIAARKIMKTGDAHDTGSSK